MLLRTLGCVFRDAVNRAILKHDSEAFPGKLSFLLWRFNHSKIETMRICILG